MSQAAMPPHPNLLPASGEKEQKSARVAGAMSLDPGYSIFDPLFLHARVEGLENWPPLFLLAVDEASDLGRRHWIHIGAAQSELLCELRFAQHLSQALI